MLRSLGINKTRFQVPPLIKSGIGEVAGLTGSAVTPLLLAGREHATGIETKQQHSSGVLQTIYSPPSHLHKGPSPRLSPGKPPFYTDGFAESLGPESTASINNFIMETPESTRSIDSGKKLSLAIQKHEPQTIVVVVDATKELQLAPLKYALDISAPGDKLFLLGILHQVMNPSTSPPKKFLPASMIHKMGYKQKAGPNFNGSSNHVIIEEQRKKTAEFEKCISQPELQKLFALKQVTPRIHIAPGLDRKVVTAKQAVELGAKWVILDKHLKGDKSYLVEQLNCNLVLMKPKNQAVMLKPEQEQNENRNSPGDFQVTLDKSLDLGPGAMVNAMSPKTLSESAEKRVSRSLIQNSSSSAPAVRVLATELSRSTVQQLTNTKISTPSAEDNHEQSVWTEPSSTSVPSPRGEFLDLNLPSVPLSDDDISPAEGSLSTLSKGDELTMDCDRDRQTGSGLGISSDLEKVGSESEDDTLNPTLKVGSLGTSCSEAFYKITSRPSMSTGDLQSLVPNSSAATLYRPAPRNASDKGGDELINILNTAPSCTPSATPRSTRTLQRSLQEEDLLLQASNIGNSPIGRVNKFGGQSEDNLLDDTIHGRRKTPKPFAPLCSKCNKPTPVFGSEARKFTYAELEKATNNFDQENYIAEGGYGFVYRGKLAGGQEIAVKQYKAASTQGDDEFFSEVDVLKHAQHRNLVILVGYCTENARRLLVYEFVCNKSLDVHLSVKNVNVLEWKWRWKIAVGAARGLRYLHEECRVGCIVHRDMRPNNILLTHDYVPMVGDFGLARSQPIGDKAEETRVIGTLGYLAPEYAASGSITEKADVYSFGVVLLELITGRKAIDATRARGQACLTEWAGPKIPHILKSGSAADIVDPRLKDDYDVEQVIKMIGAAGRCISRDPDERPRMSEVLRLLEQEASSDTSISRANSVNDLAIITRNENHNDLIREGSLDSALSAASSKGSRATSGNPVHSKNSGSTPVSIPRTTHRIKAKSEKFDRSASPRSRLKATANSPSGGKSGLSSRTKKLSYALML